MTRLWSRFMLAVLVALIAHTGAVWAQGYPAYTAITGGAFQAGLSSTLLVETDVPDVFEMYSFQPTSSTPVVAGAWASVGFVLIEEEFGRPLDQGISSTGQIQVGGGSSLGASIDARFAAVAGKAVPHGSTGLFFSGMLGRFELRTDGAPPACQPVLLALPMLIHDDMPMATSAAAAFAAEAHSEAGGQGGDGSVPGVNQACFDGATTRVDCDVCFDKCWDDAQARWRVCKASCPTFSWAAVGVCSVSGGTVGAGVGTCISPGVGTGVGGAIGCILGGLGGAIFGHADCVETCRRIRRAEQSNCERARRACLLVH